MLINELQRASYKGIPFYFKSSSTTGGRKTITHEYPLTDRRFVEDLGKNERIFTIECIISGENYLQDRNAFQGVLEEAGAGILSHPFYGNVKVVPKNYTVVEDIANLGVANFNVVFEKAELNIFPTQSSDNTSLISSKTTAIEQSAISKFVNKYKLTKNVINNFNYAKDKVNAVIGVFENVSKGINKVASKINQFSSDIIDFKQNINTIINSPQNLASSITGLFNALSFLAQNPFDNLDMLAGFYSFGSNDNDLLANTNSQIENKDNGDALNDLILIESMTYSFENITTLTFENTDQINEIRKKINSQYESLIDKESLDTELADDLSSQKAQVDKYLDSQELVTPKIINIETNTIPMFVLAYKYYGNTDKTYTLIDLNNDKNISFIKGSVRILSQ